VSQETTHTSKVEKLDSKIKEKLHQCDRDSLDGKVSRGSKDVFDFALRWLCVSIHPDCVDDKHGKVRSGPLDSVVRTASTDAKRAADTDEVIQASAPDPEVVGELID
jgi:hypothetical protein